MTQRQTPLAQQVWLRIKEYGTARIQQEGPLAMRDALTILLERVKAGTFRKQLTVEFFREQPVDASDESEKFELEFLSRLGIDGDQIEEIEEREANPMVGDQLKNECFRKLRIEYPKGTLTEEEARHWIRVAEDHGWNDLIK